ncbi:hypothetical protein C0989_003582 [Termitomyces sp. Mn162]|nr:hypothetical protein C0989_003582 [Termitomyces sp. Mn162]
MTVQIRAITALIFCLHFIVISASPTPSWSVHRPRKHAKWMLARQANRSQDTKANDAPSNLPPVSVVFNMMADAHQSVKPAQVHVSPTVTSQVLVVPASSTLPTAAKVDAALAPTITIVQSSSLASSRSPTATPEAHASEQSAVTRPFAPTGSSILSENSGNFRGITEASNPNGSGTASSVHPMETGTTLDAAQHTSTDATPHGTASRLLMICAVMASLIALMFLVYIILNYRLFAICGRKQEEEEDSWRKIASPPLPGTYQDAEKEIVYQTPRSQLSASSVYSSHPSESPGSVSVSNARFDSTIPEVIDISLNFPRSKFSICSSEYPASIRSQSSTHSIVAPLHGEQADPSTFLPAHGFDCQPPQPLEDNRHSRTHSEPIVRPDNTGGASQLLVRAIHHRRSRSISGLTYTVKQEQRESGSSAGNWTESPRSPSGWPSAL